MIHFILRILFMTSTWSYGALELPYLDSQFPCFDAKQAQAFVRDFSIDVASFGGLELCNSQVDTKKLLNDLALVQQGQFASQGSNLYIRGFVDANNYYGWMKNQTRGMERGNDIPYATAYNSGGYFTMQDGWASSSTLGRVGTVIHEARHTAGYRHVACNQGTYQGSSVSACDTDYDYGGSHAVEMEYYARVSVLGQNFHPIYRTMARLMGIARSNFLFNRSPIVKKEGLLSVTSDSRGFLLSDGTLFEREVPVLPHGRLKRTSYGGVIADEMKALAIELYENSGFRPTIDDTYSYFKLIGRDSDGVFDLEEYDIGTKRFLVQIDLKNQIAAYNFPQGNWNSLRSLPFSVEKTTTTLENGQRGYFLIDAAGSIYPFDANNGRVGAVLKEKWNFQVEALARVGDDMFVLKNDGKIYLRQQNQGEKIWSEDASGYAGLVAAPIYNGFEVKK